MTMHLLNKVVPDMVDKLEGKYYLMRQIKLKQPIGRRSLAQLTDSSERIVRGHIDDLSQTGIVIRDNAGVQLSALGEEVLEKLEEIMAEFLGIDDLKKRLKQHLGVKEVYIVPGDVDINPGVKEGIGLLAAKVLKEKLSSENTIAVTGGSTVAQVPDFLTGQEIKNLVVVPSRGGNQDDIDIQANTIASRIAKKLNAQFIPLYLPEIVTKSAERILLEDVGISKTMNIIKRADVLLHGIGIAEVMARKRNTATGLMLQLKEKEAVGEAVGGYFKRDGSIATVSEAIGLNVNDLENINIKIALAGGSSKAEAISAVAFYGQMDVLITDEGAAKAILD
ncbi:central glycolytic genes regulator [Desulfitispora alkaliphila]|uniref:sugar-binding transcriptional regulator n=1 Tax=Desulfitispora alkaliphila TaxID=622674 RepID=UPI003D24035F